MSPPRRPTSPGRDAASEGTAARAAPEADGGSCTQPQATARCHWTVAAALADAQAQGVARLDAQLLLAEQLACSRSWLLAHDDALLDEPQVAGFRADVARRVDDVPLAYLVGRKEFHGLMLDVDPSVLVPRPETEHLVDWALALLGGTGTGEAEAGAATVVDLGTGSGAIALAVKAADPRAEVVATDLSIEAIATARHNATRLALDVEFRHGAWWAPLEGRRFQLALSNPPYIVAGDPHLAALRHEPLGALAAGADGLDALREIIAGAPRHLEAGGWLLLEHGHDQAPAVQSLLATAGFRDIQTRTDLAGLPRCSGGRR